MKSLGGQSRQHLSSKAGTPYGLLPDSSEELRLDVESGHKTREDDIKLTSKIYNAPTIGSDGGIDATQLLLQMEVYRRRWAVLCGVGTFEKDYQQTQIADLMNEALNSSRSQSELFTGVMATLADTMQCSPPLHYSPDDISTPVSQRSSVKPQYAHGMAAYAEVAAAMYLMVFHRSRVDAARQSLMRPDIGKMNLLLHRYLHFIQGFNFTTGLGAKNKDLIAKRKAFRSLLAVMLADITGLPYAKLHKQISRTASVFTVATPRYNIVTPAMVFNRTLTGTSEDFLTKKRIDYLFNLTAEQMTSIQNRSSDLFVTTRGRCCFGSKKTVSLDQALYRDFAFNRDLSQSSVNLSFFNGTFTDRRHEGLDNAWLYTVTMECNKKRQFEDVDSISDDESDPDDNSRVKVRVRNTSTSSHYSQGSVRESKSHGRGGTRSSGSELYRDTSYNYQIEQVTYTMMCCGTPTPIHEKDTQAKRIEMTVKNLHQMVLHVISSSMRCPFPSGAEEEKQAIAEYTDRFQNFWGSTVRPAVMLLSLLSPTWMQRWLRCCLSRDSNDHQLYAILKQSVAQYRHFDIRLGVNPYNKIKECSHVDIEDILGWYSEFLTRVSYTVRSDEQQAMINEIRYNHNLLQRIQERPAASHWIAPVLFQMAWCLVKPLRFSLPVAPCLVFCKSDKDRGFVFRSLVELRALTRMAKGDAFDPVEIALQRKVNSRIQQGIINSMVLLYLNSTAELAHIGQQSSQIIPKFAAEVMVSYRGQRQGCLTSCCFSVGVVPGLFALVSVSIAGYFLWTMKRASVHVLGKVVASVMGVLLIMGLLKQYSQMKSDCCPRKRFTDFHQALKSIKGFNKHKVKLPSVTRSGIYISVVPIVGVGLILGLDWLFSMMRWDQGPFHLEDPKDILKVTMALTAAMGLAEVVFRGKRCCQKRSFRKKYGQPGSLNRFFPPRDATFAWDRRDSVEYYDNPSFNPK